jgi:hypothetical protein
MFGRTNASPEIAYKFLSRFGGLLFVTELLMVLVILRASRRACRYIGLALAMPLVIGFFGYYEQGCMRCQDSSFSRLVAQRRSESRHGPAARRVHRDRRGSMARLTQTTHRVRGLGGARAGSRDVLGCGCRSHMDRVWAP